MTATILEDRVMPQGLTPQEQGDYEELRQAAAEFFEDPDLWLNSYHPLLGTLKPWQYLKVDRKRVILDLLAALRHGDFS